MLTVFKSLKRPLLAIVFPRLCFIGFTFCQPFLISATLTWAERDSNSDDASQGYGLIGAWFLVFVGLAVSLHSKQNGSIILTDITGDNRSIPAHDCPRHNHGTWSAHLDAV